MGWPIMVARLLCALYALGLTILLLVPKPWALLGIAKPPGLGSDRGLHFVLLSALALLVFASRLPMRRWAMLAVLATYGLVVESLQWFFPPRTVELRDYLENLLGVAVGAGLWWLLARAVFRPLPRPVVVESRS